MNVGTERHDALPLRAIAAIILVAEGDARLVEGEQPPVRDGDAVRIAREIGQHRFGAGERRLGVAPQRLWRTGERWCRKARRSASGARPPKKASLSASCRAISQVRNRRRNSRS